jgi:hypothetical protein
VPIASNGIRSSLDGELGAVDTTFGRKLLDDDVPAAGKLPGIEWCGTVHAAEATRAVNEMVRDVADLSEPRL